MERCLKSILFIMSDQLLADGLISQGLIGALTLVPYSRIQNDSLWTPWKVQSTPNVQSLDALLSSN